MRSLPRAILRKRKSLQASLRFKAPVLPYAMPCLLTPLCNVKFRFAPLHIVPPRQSQKLTSKLALQSSSFAIRNAQLAYVALQCEVPLCSTSHCGFSPAPKACKRACAFGAGSKLSKKGPGTAAHQPFVCCVFDYFLPYFLLNFSTRPPASTRDF